MSEGFVLTEYQDWVGSLSDEDADFLDREFAKRITHRREVTPVGTRDIVNPNQYVGVLVLPSGARVELRPKIPTTNVFYMLSIAERLPDPFRDELARYESLDEILEFVARYFHSLAEDRIAAGLVRAYVETEDNLPFVRGRIGFAEDIRVNWVLRHRTYCRFTELTWDIPENQVIRQVASFLSGWPFSEGLRRRLARLDASMAEVSATQMTVGALDRIVYGRMNEPYREIHALCRLFMEESTLSESAGAFTFQTFLIDMNKLFEKYITEVLRSAAGSIGAPFSDQHPMHLDEAGDVDMKPDFVVGTGWRSQIGDCKYKKLEEGEFQNHDLYQILAYCTSGEVESGVLVYPQHLVPIEAELKVKGSGVHIRQLTISLRGTAEELRMASAELAQRVLGQVGALAVAV